MNPEEQRTSCPGFLDEYGTWNNGFECPPLSGQIRICCGSDSRRYCCSLESFQTSSYTPLNRHDKSPFSTNETSLSFIEKMTSNMLTLPFLLSYILMIIIILLSITITLFFCYRYCKRNKKPKGKHLSTNQPLLIDHFPFSPPHHQLFFNENNPQTSSLLYQQAKDTLTTTTTSTSSSSSSSARISSDIYLNDWKEFFTTNEQPMNTYPTVSSHSNEMNNDLSYYIFHGKHQQDDIII